MNLRLAQDEHSRMEAGFQTKLIVAVAGMSFMFCLLLFFIVSALHQIVRLTLLRLTLQGFGLQRKTANFPISRQQAFVPH